MLSIKISPNKIAKIMRSMQNILIISLILLSTALQAQSGPARSLTPPNEPKADSFYICYEKRFTNTITQSVFTEFTDFKYIGCIISRLPCHLYCSEKMQNCAQTKLFQFQWVNTYHKALNSFYRCAYS